MFTNSQNRFEFPAIGGLDEVFPAVLRNVYAWMFLGLATTAGVALVTAGSPLVSVLTQNPILLLVLMLAELGLVFGISAGINRISVGAAAGLFFAYSVLNGITLSLIFLVFTLGSIFMAFVAAAALFGAMSVIGYTTHLDLSKAGSFLMMALLGLVIASIVSLFWANSVLQGVITFAGILIFLGLTVYDTQRIKRMTATALAQGDEQVVGRYGILGALSLYLDFINLFLMLLRLMGRRR
ncbi:MAG TPA: Bax inhibitor-1/YccA family protein [Anaerolineales bacterium]